MGKRPGSRFFVRRCFCSKPQGRRGGWVWGRLLSLWLCPHWDLGASSSHNFVRESGVPGGRGGGKDNWERKHTDIECPHARLWVESPGCKDEQEKSCSRRASQDVEGTRPMDAANTESAMLSGGGQTWDSVILTTWALDATGTRPHAEQPGAVSRRGWRGGNLVLGAKLGQPTQLALTCEKLSLELSSMHACSVTQSFSTLCDPMDCSLPGSSVHGIFRTRMLEWVAMPSSRGSCQPRNWNHITCLQANSLASEPPGKSWHLVLLTKGPKMNDSINNMKCGIL